MDRLKLSEYIARGAALGITHTLRQTVAGYRSPDDEVHNFRACPLATGYIGWRNPATPEDLTAIERDLLGDTQCFERVVAALENVGILPEDDRQYDLADTTGGMEEIHNLAMCVQILTDDAQWSRDQVVAWLRSVDQ